MTEQLPDAPDGSDPQRQDHGGPSTEPHAAPEERPRGVLRLGTAFGAPIYLTTSWLLVAVFVMTTSTSYLRDRTEVSPFGASMLALAYALALALSVLAHELGHTAVSHAVGIRVRRIVVFLMGGVSEMEDEPSGPAQELLIAVAGPMVSLAIGGICLVAGNTLGGIHPVSVVLGLLAWSNLAIGVFNLLPGLPLDGGRVVQAIGWQVTGSRLKGIVAGAWSGRGVAVLVGMAVILGSSYLQQGNDPGWREFVATGLGFAVAAFLWMGATRSLHAAEIGGRAAGLDIGHLVRPAIYLPPATPIAEALRQVALARASGIVVVDGDGRSRAIVREAQISGLPLEQRPWATIADVARPLEPGLVVQDSVTGAQLLRTLQRTPASEYLVVGGDGISRGVIATVDVARALGLSAG